MRESDHTRPSTAEVSTTNQRITMLPTVLMNALKECTFVGSPLWRMSDGNDLVRVELTFHRYYQPTVTRRGLKAGGSLHPLLASGLVSPHQPDEYIDTSSSINAQFGAGGNTTNAADTTRHRKRLHNIRPHPEDSYHRAITSHQETCHTAYYSRQPAKEEIKNELSARDLSEPPVEIYYDIISQPFPLHKKYDLIDVYNPTF